MPGPADTAVRRLDPGRIDSTVVPGTSEVWEPRNASDNQHVFHVHGLSFTVLSRDGDRPPAQSAGSKDQVLLPSGTTTRIALRFGTDADTEAPYMFHCHVLAQGHRMMGQVTVAGAAR